MKQSAVINKQSCLIAFMALVLNCLFLFFNVRNMYYLGLLTVHGEIAYNVYRYNSIKINPDRLAYIAKLQEKMGRMVDYQEIDAEKFGPPSIYRSIQDTVGYGVLLGLIWKLTGSLRYLDMQILQILIFSLLMFMLYHLALLFFQESVIALFCAGAMLCFLPIFYANVQVMRDIWTYYGLLILLWGCGLFFWQKASCLLIGLVGVLFALIQWIRPNIFAGLVCATMVLIGYACFRRQEIRRVVQALFLLWAGNGLFFWTPFMMYNKIAYNHYFVMSSGQGLIEGLGEYPNRWGFCLDDQWVAHYIEQKYGLSYGTQEFDDKVKEEFHRAYREDPWHFYFSIARRIPLFIFPGLVWNNYTNVQHPPLYSSCYVKVCAIIQKSFHSWPAFFDLIIRQILVRLFLLLGYIGMVYALMHQKYLFFFLCAGAGIFPAAACLTSHIEYRYITPFYGMFVFFVGYAVWHMYRNYSGYKRFFKMNAYHFILRPKGLSVIRKA